MELILVLLEVVVLREHLVLVHLEHLVVQERLVQAEQVV
jgi:hypothetical protein